MMIGIGIAVVSVGFLLATYMWAYAHGRHDAENTTSADNVIFFKSTIKVLLDDVTRQVNELVADTPERTVGEIIRKYLTNLHENIK